MSPPDAVSVPRAGGGSASRGGRARVATRRLAPVPLAAAILAFYLHPAPVYAGKWTITPRVSTTETYSDNINLAPAGAKQGDFVTDLSAGLSAHGEGRRLKLDFDYNLQGLKYARGTSASTINQQLQAIGNAELYRQVFFVDFNATARQENASDSGPLANSNISVTNNRTNVLTYSLSPFVRHHFGAYADAVVRTTFDKVKNSGSSTGSFTRTLDLQLDSGRRFGRTPWSLRFNRRRENNDTGPSSTFQRVDGTLNYRFSRRYGANAAIGIENNNFANQGANNNGVTWSAGLDWTPTPRSQFSFGLEHRFFGSAFFFNGSHRSHRAVFAASYREDTTTSSQIQLQRQLITLVDPFGQPIADPNTGQALLVPTNTPTLTNEVIVQKSFQGSINFQGRRTNAGVSLFDDRREFQLSGDTEHVYGLSASASRTLSRRTSVNLGASWQRTKPRAGGASDSRWNVSLGTSYQIARSLSASVNLSHDVQDSSVPSGGFKENRISAQLNVRL